ncbi:MAG TPA: radical SAM family heme chaperone HemW [Gemmatimonadales bacterium]
MHVYLHVPFCGRRCSYCDFAIAVRNVTPDAAFLAAITGEIALRRGAERWPAGPVQTIYFGGGTPSRLDPLTITQLIAVLSGIWPRAADAEITLEANPDDVTAERARGWVRAGINRISLGVQSHDAAVLEWMHRTHRAEQVPEALAILRAEGITNISLDLIFALPETLRRNWSDDLQRTLALAPDHVSLYGLTVEAHTPLARWVGRGEIVTPMDERYADEYLLAHEQLIAAGFEHYEVSNAARPGFRSRHNSAYWSGAPYVGLGPSAHSLLADARQWNVREWEAFRRRVDEAATPVEGQETIDGAPKRLEDLYLGLRTIEGASQAMVPAGARAAWVRAGWATTEGGRIRLTVEGWLRLDALVGAVRDS